jgi:hypothetical protein
MFLPIARCRRIRSRTRRAASSGRIDVLKAELPAVTQSVEQFLEEATVRNLAATTIKKRRELLEPALPVSAARSSFALRSAPASVARDDYN